ncbi:TrkH family potassium uptake protein [Prochlorothrix hollandica]|uniref:ATPase n=1 Tax=Prochlorothrix hollandica PCC 9006 = CALU 1027 TaxID=317619 RepID=A0A0M2PXH2_PROHO|nr:TrkH family potassium uptake protein [Prochlorothrix hollandica]KKJ00855.1 ATPase [Prochlorothrix hollandica PCC 9006 = CALU 1027]
MTISRSICLGFLALITAGTLLLMLPFSHSDGHWGILSTALFTATSAVCVTGLSVVDVGQYYSGLGQFFIALMAQVGGLGYMTATTFLLLLLGRKFRLRDKLAMHQSLDTSGISGMQHLVKSIIGMTLMLEILGILLLLPVFEPDYGLGQGLWMATFHSINAFNNAGFGLLSNSFMDYATDPLLNVAITLMIILGGIGYQVLLELYLWGRDRVSQKPIRFTFSLHFKIVTSTTLFLLFLGTLSFFLTEFNNPATLGTLTVGEKLIAAWFQSVTTRTAGFNTVDLSQMTTTSLFLTIAFMFVGASPGSTGGGLKTTTLRVLVMCTRAVLQGKEEVLCYQRKIPMSLILKAIGGVMASLLTVIVATILMSLAAPTQEFLPVLFEVVSAFATVGLSIGITAQANLTTQLILVLVMYVGRVGVLMLMSALLGDPAPSTLHYPEEDLLVG